MSHSSSSSGIGVLGLLGVAFVVLKLTHVIDWSWWYVTMPFWGSLALLFAMIAIGIFGTLITVVIASIVAFIVGWFEKRKTAKIRKRIR